jgi:hypothetical protein
VLLVVTSSIEERWQEISGRGVASMFEGTELKDLVALIGGIIGLSTLIFGIYQYWETQRWKTAEFVASKMDAFMDDPHNRIAMLMLDWNMRKIIFPRMEDTPNTGYVVDDNVLKDALRPHSLPTDVYEHPQSYIRDVFDHFFDDLDRLNTFVEARLITVEQLRPYLRYWLDILTGGRAAKPRELIEQFWIYIDFYDFGGVRELCERFGYTSLPPRAARESGVRVDNA